MAHYEKMRGSWVGCLRYTDWQGNNRYKRKQGFKTKHEAVEWERSFSLQQKKDINMSFATFYELYKRDMMPQIKRNTWHTKDMIINKHILPYFGKLSIADITALDIIQWQNELFMLRDDEGKGYSKGYLRTIQNQLFAIFNHAEQFYVLPQNPCKSVRKSAYGKKKEVEFWTEDEYLKFREVMKDKPQFFYAFEILFWCGIREGELLALSMSDFDLDKKKLKISKSYQRLEQEDLITDPKTESSNRTIELPQFLCDEMQEYFEMLYKADKNTRIFPYSKSMLIKQMIKGSEEAGVKRIRIHGFRHSCVAWMIEHGFPMQVIAERLGHSSINVTMIYSHLYPNKQATVADKMDEVFSQSISI